MDSRNDRRECENNESDQLESMNRRNCTQGEANPCHRRKNDRFAQALEEAFNEGYKKGHSDGYEEGYCQGYEEGLKDGYEKARQEVLEYIKSNRCCCKCCRCRCC